MESQFKSSCRPGLNRTPLHMFSRKFYQVLQNNYSQDRSSQRRCFIQKRVLNRSSQRRCFIQKRVLKFFCNIHKKIPVPEFSVLIKLQAEAQNVIEKETLVQVFSCEFCEILMDIFFFRRIPLAVSVKNTSEWLLLTIPEIFKSAISSKCRND